ncbi:MAG: twin-arginine translocase subunit TatB [Saprospiraceae bacterium]|nr:twin-arginine translocase subunit TatB [Pyrinomonadaceae bacterium]
MFLFIFESIGTSELILVGIIALIFLGPRKLPELARKAGKIMSDLRNTTNDFKSTWEREVDFDIEEKAFRTGELEDRPVGRVTSINDESNAVVPVPAIKSIDKEFFDSAVPEKEVTEEPTQNDDLSDKRSWL